MCEFCVSHGEGKKWYENIKNYTAEVFHKVSSEKKLKAFLNGMSGAMSRDIAKAYRWKKRFPRIYNLIAYPLITRRSKKIHFGQIVPLEDVERILDNVQTIVRLPCVCRRVTIGESKRLCFGVGMDLTDIMKDVPDFSEFERFTAEEAKERIRELDREGMVHSVWTFTTPFIGGICNCDRDCMAYRTQVSMKLAKVMWKAEYVAEINLLKCTGCKECVKSCYFNAIKFDRENQKCEINLMNCYGCGVCRAACKHDAITLQDRESLPQAAGVW